MAVSRQICKHRELLAVETHGGSQNFAEKSLHFLAMLAQNWAFDGQANRSGNNRKIVGKSGRQLGKPAFGDEHVVVDNDDDLPMRNSQGGIPRRIRAQGEVLTQVKHRPVGLGMKLVDHFTGAVIRTVVNNNDFGRSEIPSSRRKGSETSRQNRRPISRGNNNGY